MFSKMLALPLTALALCASSPAHADDSEDYPDHYATGDLDGDGKPEDISAQWDYMEGEFILTVGKATARGDSGGTEYGKVSIIDVDTRDKWKEVAVETGHAGEVHLFRFAGGKLQPLGIVRTLAEVRGDGVLVSSVWRDFWTRRDTFVLDPRTGKFSQRPQELYFVGAEATVMKSFPITISRSNKKPVAQLAPGSKIQVLAAAQADKKGAYHYYLVKSASGLLGWSIARDLLDKTEGLPTQEQAEASERSHEK